jgi:hypothetical protein
MMRQFRDKMAQASGHYSDDEWAAMESSGDPFDRLTIDNALAIADNILEMPEIKDALAMCGLP